MQAQLHADIQTLTDLLNQHANVQRLPKSSVEVAALCMLHPTLLSIEDGLLQAVSLPDWGGLVLLGNFEPDMYEINITPALEEQVAALAPQAAHLSAIVERVVELLPRAGGIEHTPSDIE